MLTREYSTVTASDGSRFIVVRNSPSDSWRVYSTAEAHNDKHITLGFSVGVALLGTLASLLLAKSRK